MTTKPLIERSRFSADALLSRSISDVEYHSMVDFQSSSMLKRLLLSPAHYLQELGMRREPTESMRYGTLLHTLILEPGLFASRYVVLSDDDYGGGRNKTISAIKESSPGVNVIPESTFARARQARDRALERKIEGKPFGDYVAEGDREASILFTEDDFGIPCRIRPDLLHPDGIFDIKTTLKVGAQDWLRQALDLHYDLQCFMYAYGVWRLRGSHDSDLEPFWFVCLETTTASGGVSVRQASPAMIKSGCVKFMRVLKALRTAIDTNQWPAAEDDGYVEDEMLFKRALAA